ncbi:MAG: hypothetical protein KQJ78_17535 [Deltaproteobacteria bacterium]|nr:hypothetical protein [Deltaproteobacteria bacterium]
MQRVNRLWLNLGVWALSLLFTSAAGAQLSQAGPGQGPAGGARPVPVNVAPGAAAGGMITWTDPNEQAFSCPVPRGWYVEGGLKRFHAIDPRVDFLLTSPDGRIVIRIGDAVNPPFVTPNPSLEFAGFREGSDYSPGYGLHQKVLRYLPGAQFLTQYYLPLRLGQVQVVKVRAVPQIASQAARLLQANSYVKTRVDTGEVWFKLTGPQGPRVGYAFCQTRGNFTSQTPQLMTWQASHLYGYLAAPEAEDVARHLLDVIGAGFKINPHWMLAQVRMAGDTSATVAETTEAVNKIIREEFEGRQKSWDKNNAKFDRYIRGTELVRDPATGQEFEVQAGHGRYYRHGASNVIVAVPAGADKPYDPHVPYHEVNVVHDH